jgi:hypothetical protein
MEKISKEVILNDHWYKACWRYLSIFIDTMNKTFNDHYCYKLFQFSFYDKSGIDFTNNGLRVYFHLIAQYKSGIGIIDVPIFRIKYEYPFNSNNDVSRFTYQLYQKIVSELSMICIFGEDMLNIDALMSGTASLSMDNNNQYYGVTMKDLINEVSENELVRKKEEKKLGNKENGK